MPCLHPIQIYNRSSNISLRGSALIYEVPCGQCEWCKEQKFNEYALRTYIEYQDTIRRGGFVYFDTFTYRNKCLPKHFGICHFNRNDIVQCNKKLRIYLKRAGYEVNGNLKYFVTSEYGGKTHRPHYHVLYFITIPNLDVRDFWKYLNKAWIYGFIDKRSTCVNRVVNSSAALNYISKYVQKDQEWQEVVDKKIEELKMKDFKKYFKLKDKLNDFKPFHLQSQGLGIGLLYFVPIEDIIKTGLITIPDRKFVKKSYSIPMYYNRKLFYDLEKYDDGSIHWKLNQRGKEFKVARLDEKIQYIANGYKDVIYNIKQYNISDDYFEDKAIEAIAEMLDGRTLEDLATYQLVYRNKMSEELELPNYKDFYRMSLEEGDEYNGLFDSDQSVRNYYRTQLDGIRITQDWNTNQFYNFDDLLFVFKYLQGFVNDAVEKNKKRIIALRNRLKLITAI